MQILSRTQFNAILRSLVAQLSASLTNAQAARVGINLSPAHSYEYGHTYLDWTRRFNAPFYDGTDTSVSVPSALKANRAPASTYHYLLQATSLAADVGTYNCWMPGTAASITASIGTISALTYNSGTDTTTFTYTLSASGGGGISIVVTNPSTSSDYIRIIPAGYDPVANANDFHPDLIARLAAYKVMSIRGMDWLYTNGNTDTNWAGSTAAGADGSIRGKTASLAEFCRLANIANVNVQVNAPPGATTDWMSNALAVIGATLNTSLLCRCEYSNEPWNFGIGNAYTHVNTAMALGGTFSNGNASVVGMKRASGVVTINLNAAPASAGPFYVTGFVGIASNNNIAAGNITVTGNNFSYPEAGPDLEVLLTANMASAARAGNVVTITMKAPPLTAGPFQVPPLTTGGGSQVSAGGLITPTSVSGSVITYSETGSNATAYLTGSYVAYLHTNLAHYIVKAPTTIGDASSNGVDPFTMLYREVVEQTRNWWTLAQSLPDKARYRFVLNVQVGVQEFKLYPYAIERFGSADWLEMLMIAPYVQAGTLAAVTIADDVFALLAPKLAAYPKILVQQANAARSFRKPVGYYEGGQGTPDIHSSTTIAAAVNAANHDDRMRTLLFDQSAGSYTAPSLMGFMRDLAGARVFNFFKDGCSPSFNTTADNYTWNILDVSPTDLSGPKPQALIQYANAASAPQSYPGLTWGTINFLDVCAFGSSGGTASLIANNTQKMPDIVVAIVPPSGQTTATLSIAIGSAAGTPNDWVTVSLNEQVLANQVVLTTGYPTPNGLVFSQTVTVVPGAFNEIRLQFKPANRSQYMALHHIAVS